jgi:hypothetical protein
MQLNFFERGQGLAIDFLFAILVFLLLLNGSMVLIESSSKLSSDESILNALNSTALHTADMLVRTKGEPNDWHENDIGYAERVGLAKRDRVLESKRLSKFLEWSQSYGSSDYNKVKGLLLIGYDYYLKVSDSDGVVLHETGVPGDSRWDGMHAVSVRRIVSIGEEEVAVDFAIYCPRQ